MGVITVQPAGLIGRRNLPGTDGTHVHVFPAYDGVGVSDLGDLACS